MENNKKRRNTLFALEQKLFGDKTSQQQSRQPKEKKQQQQQKKRKQPKEQGQIYDFGEAIELEYDRAASPSVTPEAISFSAPNSFASELEDESLPFTVEAFETDEPVAPISKPATPQAQTELEPEVQPGATSEQMEVQPVKTTVVPPSEMPLEPTRSIKQPTTVESSISQEELSEDRTFAEDLQAILNGQKTYDAEEKQVVSTSPSAAPTPASTAHPHDIFDKGKTTTLSTQPIQPEPVSTSRSHAVFDHMGQNMAHATNFDQGTLELSLEQRFDEFDRLLDEEENKSLRQSEPASKAMQPIETVPHIPVNPSQEDNFAVMNSAEPKNYSHQLGGTKNLRVFCTDRLPQSDLHNLMKASENFTLATGDQSLGEAISSHKKFYYEGIQHKQLLMDDMCRLDEGLRNLKNSKNEKDKKLLKTLLEEKRSDLIVDDLINYHQVLNASGQLLEDEINHLKSLLINACYPPAVPEDALIFVTCKDAGGQGDIINAVNTKKLLEEIYKWKNVHLAMPSTAHEKARKLGYKDVWLIDDSKTRRMENIRNWPEKQRSKNVIVIHAAAPLNNTFDEILKKSCTLGRWQNAKTIFLSEYGFSNGDRGMKRKGYKDSMGIGVGELGIHLDRSFLEAFGQSKQDRLKNLESVKDEFIETGLLNGLSTDKYSKNHRLYVGYSHRSCIQFLELIASMESFIDDKKNMTIDIILVGNNNQKKVTKISNHYRDLLKQLDDKKSILNSLGFSGIEINFSSGEEPYKLALQSNNNAESPKQKSQGKKDFLLRDFFAIINPKLEFAKAHRDEKKIEYNEILLDLGNWLSQEETQDHFRSLAHTICKYRNFQDFFGSYISRKSHSDNPDMNAPELKVRQSKSLDKIAINAKKLHEIAHEKFS